MSKEKDENEWVYDRERIAVAILVMIIIIGAAWLVVDSLESKESRNVSYTLTEDRDTDQIDLVYKTFFGHSRYMENASLIKIILRVADVPDVSSVSISVNTILPMHLSAIVISEYPAESNVLHGQNQIPAEQTSYAVTLNLGQQNLIVYLFFENAEGSFAFSINLF